jgi:poly-beta-hydroxyalkanoate depolymerase
VSKSHGGNARHHRFSDFLLETIQIIGYPIYGNHHAAVCQNLVPLVNIKIAGKWMFIPLKMVLIGIDPYPCNILYNMATDT